MPDVDMEGVGLRVSAWETREQSSRHHLIIEGAILPGVPYMHRRMRRGAGGGSCPPKFGQNSGENSGKASVNMSVGKNVDKMIDIFAARKGRKQDFF